MAKEEEKAVKTINFLFLGAAVYFGTQNTFNMDDFKKQMPTYDDSFVYVSKVMKYGKELVQIVFVDKTDEYRAYSVGNAKNLYSWVKERM